MFLHDCDQSVTITGSGAPHILLAPQLLTFPCLPFSADGVFLYARFHRLHRGGYVKEVNKELADHGLRPMTRGEFTAFVDTYENVLSVLAKTQQVNLVATDPESIVLSEETDRISLLPGAWTEKGSFIRGEARIRNFDDHGAYLSDDFFTIVSVDLSL